MKFRYLILLSAFLWTGCDDSDSTVTPVNQGPTLRSVTTYLMNESGDYVLSDKTIFSYSSGYLSSKQFFTYDSDAKDFVLTSSASFTFDNGKLNKIEEIMEGVENHRNTTYTYSGVDVSKIKLQDYSGVTTTATIAKVENDTVEVNYAVSNGNSFKYRFSTTGHNIELEKTLDGSGKLSSRISNEFDSGINPYSLLGFTDFFFSNFSQNNKTQSDGEYFSHQPEATPSSYEYVYDDSSLKLPIEQYITYKGYPGGAVTLRSKVVFEYDQ